MISSLTSLQTQLNSIDNFMVTPQNSDIYTYTSYQFKISVSFLYPDYSSIVIGVPIELQSYEFQTYQLTQGFNPAETIIQFTPTQITIKQGLLLTQSSFEITVSRFQNPYFAQQISPFTVSIFNSEYVLATLDSNQIFFVPKIFDITSILSSSQKVAQYPVQLRIEMITQHIIHKDDRLIIEFLDTDFVLTQNIVCLINRVKSPCSITDDKIEISNSFKALNAGSIQIVVQDLQNPATMKVFSDFIAIQHKSEDGKHYQTSNTMTPTLQLSQAQSLRSFMVNSLNPQYYEPSSYQVSIESPIALLAESVIEIEFPVSLTGAEVEVNEYLKDFVVNGQKARGKLKSLISEGTSVVVEIGLITNPGRYIKGFDVQIWNPNEAVALIADSNQDLIEFAGKQLVSLEIRFSSLQFDTGTSLEVTFETNFEVSGGLLFTLPPTLGGDYQMTANLPRGLNSFVIEGLLVPSSNAQEMKFRLETFNQDGNLMESGEHSLGYPFVCGGDCYQCQKQNCLKCHDGLVQYSNQCLGQCPQRMVDRIGVCYSCRTTMDCLQCSADDLSYCLKCKAGFVPFNGFCLQESVAQDQVPEEETLNEEVPKQEEEYKEEIQEEVHLEEQQESIEEEQNKQTQEEQEENSKEQLAEGNEEENQVEEGEKGEAYQINESRTRLDGKGLFLIYILVVEIILLIIRKITRINQQMLATILKVDANYNETIQRGKMGKLINMALLFYDWKIILITMSKLTDNKLFQIEYDQSSELLKKVAFLTKLKVTVFQPSIMILSLYYLIFYFSSYQLDYLIYNAIHTLVLIYSLYKQLQWQQAFKSTQMRKCENLTPEKIKEDEEQKSK